MRNHAAAAALGVTYDAWSNFLPLCGDMNTEKSCHAAFDNAKLAFAATEDPGVYDIVTHPSFSYLRRCKVEMPHASPRALEAHYAFCLLNGLVDPPPFLLERNAAAKSSERPHPPASTTTAAAAGAGADKHPVVSLGDGALVANVPGCGADFTECLPAVDCQAPGCSDEAFVLILPKAVDADAGMHLTRASTGGAARAGQTVPRAVLPHGSHMAVVSPPDIERWVKAIVGPQAAVAAGTRYQLRLGMAEPNVATPPPPQSSSSSAAGCISTGVLGFAFLEAVPPVLLPTTGATGSSRQVGTLCIVVAFVDADGRRCELRFADGASGTSSHLSWTGGAANSDSGGAHVDATHSAHSNDHDRSLMVLPSVPSDICVQRLPPAPIFAAKLPLGKASDAHWRRLLSAVATAKDGQYAELVAAVVGAAAAESGARTPVKWGSALSAVTCTLTMASWSAMPHTDSSERCWIGKVNRADAAPFDIISLSACDATTTTTHLRAGDAIKRETYVALAPEPSATGVVAAADTLQLTLARFICSASAACALAVRETTAADTLLRMRLYNSHAESSSNMEPPRPRFVAGRTLRNVPWRGLMPRPGSIIMCRRAGHQTAVPLLFPQRNAGWADHIPQTHAAGLGSSEHRLVLLRAELVEEPGDAVHCALHSIIDGPLPPLTVPTAAAIASAQITAGLFPLTKSAKGAFRVLLHAVSGSVPAVEVLVPAGAEPGAPPTLAEVRDGTAPEVCRVAISGGGAAFVSVKMQPCIMSPRLSAADTDALRKWCGELTRQLKKATALERLAKPVTLATVAAPAIRLGLQGDDGDRVEVLNPTAAWSESIEQFAPFPGHRPILEVRRFGALPTAAPSPAHPPTVTGTVELIAVDDTDLRRVLAKHVRDALVPPTLGNRKDNPPTLVHHVAGAEEAPEDGCIRSAAHVLDFGRRLVLGEANCANASLYGEPKSLEVVATFEDGYTIGLQIGTGRNPAHHVVEGCRRLVHGAPGVSKLRWRGLSEVTKAAPEVAVLAKLAKTAREDAKAGPVPVPASKRKLVNCDVVRSYASAESTEHGVIERVGRISRTPNAEGFSLRWAERFVVPNDLAHAFCDMPLPLDASLDAEVAAMASAAGIEGSSAAVAAAAGRFVAGDAFHTKPTWASGLDTSSHIAAPWAHSLVQLQLPYPAATASVCTTGVLVRAPADGCLDLEAEEQPWVRRGESVVMVPFSSRNFRELMGGSKATPTPTTPATMAHWSKPVRFASPVLGPEAAFEARGFVFDDAHTEESFSKEAMLFRILRPKSVGADTDNNTEWPVSPNSFHAVPLLNATDCTVKPGITLTGQAVSCPDLAPAGMPVFLPSGHFAGFGAPARSGDRSWQHLMAVQLRSIARRWRLLGR